MTFVHKAKTGRGNSSPLGIKIGWSCPVYRDNGRRTQLGIYKEHLVGASVTNPKSR